MCIYNLCVIILFDQEQEKSNESCVFAISCPSPINAQELARDREISRDQQRELAN